MGATVYTLSNFCDSKEEEERLIAEAEGAEVESKEEEVPIPLGIPPPEIPDTPLEFVSWTLTLNYIIAEILKVFII